MSESTKHPRLATITEVKENTFIFEKKPFLSLEHTIDLGKPTLGRSQYKGSNFQNHSIR